LLKGRQKHRENADVLPSRLNLISLLVQYSGFGAGKAPSDIFSKLNNALRSNQKGYVGLFLKQGAP
jgi:hypothetical protein